MKKITNPKHQTTSNIQIPMTKLFLVIRILILCIVPIGSNLGFVYWNLDIANAGSVQFSTYYPSPFGMYDRLRLVPRTHLDPPCDPGTMYINNEAGNQLEVCNTAGDAWAPLSGGPWTEDANGVYVTDTAANVGIGTATPTSRLHVDAPEGDAPPGVFLENADITVNGGADGQFALRNNSASGTRKISLSGPGLGTEVMTVDAQNSLVGIGTTAPSAKLHVRGANDTAEVVAFMPGTDTVAAGTPSLNVGIGTTAPSAKLTVVTDNNEDSGWYSYNNTDGSDFDFYIYRARGTSAAPLAVNSANNLGGLNFLGYDGTDFEWGAHIQANVDGTPGVNDMPGRLEFRTTPDGSNIPALRMVIKNDGNVGIGTATPTYLLDLAKDNRAIVGLSSSTNHSEVILKRTLGTLSAPSLVTNNTTIGKLEYNAWDGTAYQVAANIGAYVDGPSGAGDMPGRLEFATTLDGSTTQQTQMVIKNNGNVGIGTTTPNAGYKMHVKNSGGNALLAESDNSWAIVAQSTTGGAIEGISSTGTGVMGGGGTYDFYASGPGTDYGTTSSIRWKKNIIPIDNALNKVLKLRGVYFDWNEEHGGQHGMGMIAEEVGQIVPEVVSYEPDGTYATGMDYGHLTPVLVEAIKEQQSQIEELKAEVKELKAVLNQ